MLSVGRLIRGGARRSNRGDRVAVRRACSSGVMPSCCFVADMSDFVLSICEVNEGKFGVLYLGLLPPLSNDGREPIPAFTPESSWSSSSSDGSVADPMVSSPSATSSSRSLLRQRSPNRELSFRIRSPIRVPLKKRPIAELDSLFDSTVLCVA